MTAQVALILALACSQVESPPAGLSETEARAVRIALGALKSPETGDYQKQQALKQLGDIGPRAAAAGPEVFSFLRSLGYVDEGTARGHQVRLAFEAALTLGRLGPDASKDVAPVLLEAFAAERHPDGDSDPRQRFRDWLARPLALMLPGSEELARLFSRKLSDHDVDDRPMEEILRAVKMLRPEVRTACLPGVVACSKRERCGVHAEPIIDALLAIGPDAVPALVEGARRGRSADQDSYFVAIGRLGPQGKAAVPFLESRLLHQDAGKRRTAAAVLAQLGPAAAAAVPALIDATKDPEYSVRLGAIEALGAAGVSSPEVISALSAVARVEKGESREKALRALAALRQGGPTGRLAPDGPRR